MRDRCAVLRTLLQCVCTQRRNCIEQLSPFSEYAAVWLAGAYGVVNTVSLCVEHGQETDFSFHSRRSEQFVSISVADLFVSRRSAGRPGLDFASVGQASDSGSGWTWRTNRPVDSADHTCWDHSVYHPVSLMVGNI
jgi:hypothetical protein